MRRQTMRRPDDRLRRTVLGRWGDRRRAVRPRVPLVLARPRRQALPGRPGPVAHRADQRIALHLHVSWPARLMTSRVHHFSLEKTITRPGAPVAAGEYTQASRSALVLSSGTGTMQAARTASPPRAAGTSAAGRPGGMAISIVQQVRTHIHRRIAERVQRRASDARVQQDRGLVLVTARRRLMADASVGAAAAVAAWRAPTESARRTHPVSATVRATSRTPQQHRSPNPQAESDACRIAARPAYGQPATRTLLHQSPDRTGASSLSRPEAALPAPPARPAAAPPPIDVGRLSDEVYRHIQRRVRIERERRLG